MSFFEFNEDHPQGFTVTTTSNTDPMCSTLSNGYLQAQQSAVRGTHTGTYKGTFRVIQSMSDLDHAVFKTPIETLVNLWIAKYGIGWVDKETVMDDEFFEYTVLRLRSIGRLEEHNVWIPDIPQVAQQVVNTTTASTSVLGGFSASTASTSANIAQPSHHAAHKTVLRIVDKER